VTPAVWRRAGFLKDDRPHADSPPRRRFRAAAATLTVFRKGSTMPRLRHFVWPAVLVLLAGGAWAAWHFWPRAAGPLNGLTWGEVTRGDLEIVVSSTGSLEAIDAVEVGTQVSGTLSEVRADFNDRVKKGQILAVIDTRLLDAALRDAEAGAERARAQLDLAESELARRVQLHAHGLLPESELRTYETSVVTARAALVSAEAQLDRAHENRNFAVITAPIDGVVVERAVEAGQTVAASFNTPRLFLIARDLTRMRILAEVDEGDIGQVHEGQEVRFTVAAHADQELTGTVQQVRLQPKVEQNVVKYTVVVETDNEKGLLLPGMTATLDFLVECVRDVLTVPGAATRVRPNPAMLAMLEEQRGQRRAERGGENGEHGPGRGMGMGMGMGMSGPGGMDGPGGNGKPGGPGSDVRRIWIRDAEGQLRAQPVRVGLSDGRRVEIHPLNGEIEPGTQVVTAVASDGGPGGMRGGPRGFRVL